MHFGNIVISEKGTYSFSTQDNIFPFGIGTGYFFGLIVLNHVLEKRPTPY